MDRWYYLSRTAKPLRAFIANYAGWLRRAKTLIWGGAGQ